MKKPIQFGKYYLLERINVGGMAEVFKAKAFGVEGFERLLAVKRILPNIAEDKEFIAMFIDEAKIAVQLNHANICQIFDLGKVNDSYFIALEFVHGKDVRAIFDRCKQKPTDGSITMPIAQACFVVMKVCEGLDYAHNKKDAGGRDIHLVHRDVSPQNVIVSYEGEVKLIDFGIAKSVGKASKTQAGILKGKFGYMSPEQVRGLPLDRRSDIFSVGIVLYELLTGERLFVGESDFSTLEKVRNVEILPPSTYNRKIPDELERIVLKALAKDVEDRYQNGIDLHDDLQAFMYSAGEFYSRKDLAAWMKRSWSTELEAENAKLEAHRQFTPDGGPPPSGNHGPPPRVPARTPPPPPPGALGLVSSSPSPQQPPPSPPGPLPKAARANGKPTVRGLPGNGAALAVAAAEQHAAADELEEGLDWDDEEKETHVYDTPKDASDAIEAELAASDARAQEDDDDEDLQTDLGDLDLSPDGAPVPAKPPTGRNPVIAEPPVALGPPPVLAAAPRNGTPARATVPERPAPSVPVAFDGPPRREAAPVVGIFDDAASRDVAILRKPRPANRPIVPIAVGGGVLALILAALGVYFLVIAPGRPGELHLTSEPASDIRVLVDARPVQLEANNRLRLSPGPHVVSVEHDGYATWSDKVDVKAGEPLKRHAELEAIAAPPTAPAKTASFILHSEPGRAQAFLDGKAFDSPTPFRVDNLAPGAHQLEVRLGSKVWTQTVTLESGKVAEVHAVLANPPPPQIAPPPVSTSKSKDPESTPEKSEKRTSTARRLPPPPSSKTEKAETAEKPEPAEKPAKAEKAEKVEKAESTEKPAKAAASGEGIVRVNSKPWTHIFVDGNDTTKNTPYLNLRLPPGTHRITLVNPQFGIKETFPVEVKAGETQTIVKDLRPKAGSESDNE